MSIYKGPGCHPSSTPCVTSKALFSVQVELSKIRTPHPVTTQQLLCLRTARLLTWWALRWPSCCLTITLRRVSLLLLSIVIRLRFWCVYIDVPSVMSMVSHYSFKRPQCWFQSSKTWIFQSCLFFKSLWSYSTLYLNPTTLYYEINHLN